MLNIRTIKPDFFKSLALSKVNIGVRFAFLLLLHAANDEGIIECNLTQLCRNLYPYLNEEDVDTLKTWVEQLNKFGLIRKCSENGRDYIRITGWATYKANSESNV